MAVFGLVLILACTVSIGTFAHPAIAPSEAEALSMANGEEPKVLESKAEFSEYFAKKGMRAITPSACQAYAPVLADAAQYAAQVAQIVAASVAGNFTGKTYKDLADFVDNFGYRLAGSAELERSIDNLEKTLKASGAVNIRSESITVPAWKRGVEIATLLEPKVRNLHIKGLGQSANTPEGFLGLFPGITEDCVVYNSYLEVVANPAAAKGRIAIMNFGGPPANPLDTVDNGYALIANAGAKAALYRSAATFSLYSPHARRSSLYYNDTIAPRIPIAYLTLEDADYLTRTAARGQKIRIHLEMTNTHVNGWAKSRNLFGDLAGTTDNDEFVLYAGHTDSWDGGQGAQDDAVGVILPLESLQLLKSLGLKTKRHIRVALWTGEEYGYAGSLGYIQNPVNRRDIDTKLSVALEADYSCLASTGLIYNGADELGCVLAEIIAMAGPSATSGLLVQAPSVKSDMDLFSEINVPVVTLLGDDGRYFWFHHSEADTMTAVNSAQLDRCLGLWTSTVYVLANLQNPISRLPIPQSEL